MWALERDLTGEDKPAEKRKMTVGYWVTVVCSIYPWLSSSVGLAPDVDAGGRGPNSWKTDSNKIS